MDIPFPYKYLRHIKADLKPWSNSSRSSGTWSVSWPWGMDVTWLLHQTLTPIKRLSLWVAETHKDQTHVNKTEPHNGQATNTDGKPNPCGEKVVPRQASIGTSLVILTQNHIPYLNRAKRQFILELNLNDHGPGNTGLSYSKSHVPTWKQFHEFFFLIEQRKA